MPYHRIFLLLFTASALLSSCSGSKKSQEMTNQAELYMPLAVGNEWEYAYGLGDENRTQTIRVVGTQQFDGNTWYVLQTSFSDRELADTFHLRNQGSRLLRYRTNAKQEMALADFARNTIDSSELSMAVVTKRNHVAENEGKTWTDCVVIATGYVDAEVGTYAPGVGLVQSYWFRGRKELRRARINGKEMLK